MEVAARLALFTGALVLAVVAGWAVGVVLGTDSFLPGSARPSPAISGEHTHPTVPDIPLEGT